MTTATTMAMTMMMMTEERRGDEGKGGFERRD